MKGEMDEAVLAWPALQQQAGMLARIGEQPELELAGIERRAWLPSEVYVLVRRNGPSASASSPEA